MPHSSHRFSYLFSRYAANICTAEELQELFRFIREMPPEEIHPHMDALYDGMLAGIAAESPDWNKLYQQITQGPPAKTRRLFPWKKIAAAAAILLCGSLAIYLLRPASSVKQQAEEKSISTGDIPPARELAVLTLSDGTMVILDSSANGHILEQGGIRILKQADGELSYLQQQHPSQSNIFNTLSTPKGGHYKLTLPDGSKVWLNAASSIRYPAAFNNTARIVEITGEAYFDIVHFSNLPFFVKTKSGEIRVLGTKFNVNAYSNEELISTTLVEGKISLSTDLHPAPVLLHPGQQAQYLQTDREAPEYLRNEIKIQPVDTAPVIAWTRNAFIFSNTSLASAMRQIERWYDVEVVIKGDIGKEAIMANLSRDIPISKLMHKLSLTGNLHFTIEGKKIIVTR